MSNKIRMSVIRAGREKWKKSVKVKKVRTVRHGVWHARTHAPFSEILIIIILMRWVICATTNAGLRSTMTRCQRMFPTRHFWTNEEDRISSQRELEMSMEQIMNGSCASCAWLLTDKWHCFGARCSVGKKNETLFSRHGISVGWKKKGATLYGEVNI